LQDRRAVGDLPRKVKVERLGAITDNIAIDELIDGPVKE
jgi:hypothetical protein